ncbi:hypothetical protein SUGI_0915780 [Cryptomeria japonica]|uniref:serine/threonine-protein kinase D6PK-like n=1 Tax=Cryptomeria japonica TaxID=3369 RepID=UPI002414B876|nr:serine/threonine-protein kinase D6PK-like [Cryptomeria japonica]GLJ43931.1 hypothetical protein SUGI_0915780 [Cryptomeria japonica]
MSQKSNRSFIKRALKSLKFLRRWAAIDSTSKTLDKISESFTTAFSSNIHNTHQNIQDENISSAYWKAIKAVTGLEGNLKLNHFRKIKKIGRGGSGTVFLAELSDTKTYFAIKVADSNNMINVRREIQVLKSLRSHPLFPTLFFHCRKDGKSYFVTEYCPADLDRLRHKQPEHRFSEDIVRFYCAEILLAIEYLHMLGIVHRDLKPANVLVKEDGHILLTDFDLSRQFYVHHLLVSNNCNKSQKRVADVKKTRFLHFGSKRRGRMKKIDEIEFTAEPWGGRAHSYVGTEEYMAPEMIENKGHGGAVDWWSFGVFLYQLMYGKTPFKGNDKDETHDNVVKEELRFPDSPTVSDEAKDLIKALLVKQHWKRLGHRYGATEIKKHAFFRGIQWPLVLSRPPPNLPKPTFKMALPNGKLHLRW